MRTKSRIEKLEADTGHSDDEPEIVIISVACGPGDDPDWLIENTEPLPDKSPDGKPWPRKDNRIKILRYGLDMMPANWKVVQHEGELNSPE